MEHDCRPTDPFGIAFGMDLSSQMAVKAARRGMRVCIACAERPSFQAHKLDGVCMALTLCFLETPETAMRMCARLLRENGRLVLGILPADSTRGRVYIRKDADGHFVYPHARFLTTTETVCLVEQVGFTFRRGCSALFWEPENRKSRIRTGGNRYLR